MASRAVPRVLVVTGTDTDIGKTVVTAAVVATVRAAGLRVTAYKPTQTGAAPGEPGDVAEVARLTGIQGTEGVRLRAPMAPRPAAALEGATLPTMADHLDAVAHLASRHDVVVVEGAGGLLVELTEARETLADLAAALPDAGALVVARSALGTLNHTMLTREALSRRAVRQLGVVLGAWPDHPDVIESTNRDHLGGLPEGLLGAVPLGAPRLEPANFRSAAPSWLPGLAELLTQPSDQRLGTP